MKRNVSMEEISDGRLYGSNDMVRANCNDCKGCSSCCQGMGSSIVLDPYDVYRLCQYSNKSFEQLLGDGVELNVVDGIILPNLKMSGEEERCFYLNKEGRCSIHSHRPGICRLFPLGRIYENGSFQYFLQVHECKEQNRSKIKVSKWIDTEQLKKNEAFINRWHDHITKLQEQAKRVEDQERKQISLQLLQTFFLQPYDTNKDFYEQIEERF